MREGFNRICWVGLILITIAGAFVRLYHLGVADTRADEVYMLQPPASEYSPVEQLISETRMFKGGRTLPIPRTTATLLIYLFQLKPTQFTTRLAYALMGILTIPALCLLGVRIEGKRFGLILAFLGAINPFNLYFSRLAHMYAFAMFFLALAASFFVSGIKASVKGETLSRRDSVFLWLSALCACHTHISVWPAIGLLWLMLLVSYYLVWNVRGEGRWRLLIAFGTWALVMSPWVMIFLYSLFSADKAYYPPSYISIATQFHRLLYLPVTMGWGGGFPRILASAGLPLCAVVAATCDRKWRAPALATIGTGLVVLAVLGVGQYVGGADISTSRYYVPLWLAFILLSGIGIAWMGDALSEILHRPVGCIQFALCALLGVMTIKPIIWTVTLQAHGAPYSRINRCLDETLPKGAPVLVDRWLEPWNEMLYHSPSNVYVTFTIPDEPLDMFLRYQWRETAMEFFRKYPDAAYLELVKHYFHVPEVGFWRWPREYFKHRIVVSNEQAFALGKLSLMPDPFVHWPGLYTNRVVAEIFYNLPEDVINMARDREEKVVRFYGGGWGYTKLWQHVRGDFRDWRVLHKEATIEIHNLTDDPLDVRVHIAAVSIPDNKQVQTSSGSSFRFESGKLMSWDFDVNSVPPGRYNLMLRDPIRGEPNSALLVGDLEVSVAEGGEQQVTGDR